jgi:hypothetical protein
MINFEPGLSFVKGLVVGFRVNDLWSRFYGSETAANKGCLQGPLHISN